MQLNARHLRRRHLIQPRSRSGRRAFSLIEVLIVIAIIGLLVTMLALAIGPSLTGARVSATKVTISQLNDIVRQRLDAVNNADLKQEARRLFQTNSSAFNNVNQAEFVLRKNLLRRALPQRIEDFGGLDGDFAANADNDLPPEFSGTETPAQVFFIALTKLSSAKAFPQGKAIALPVLTLDTFNPRHMTNTMVATDPPDQFVDDWGNPIRFYTAPTALLRPTDPTVAITASDFQQAAILCADLPKFTGASLPLTDVTHPLNQDPHDPTGLLFSFAGNAQVVAFNPTPPTNPIYHDPNTFFAPLIVSAGPDELLGLGEPNAAGRARLGVINNFNEAMDNITNRQP